MSEENASDEELVLGVISPRRFVQVMAMLPALTLVATKLPGDLSWMAVSFGAAGSVLIGIVVVRAALARRRLNPLFWVLLAAQVGALVLVMSSTEALRGLF